MRKFKVRVNGEEFEVEVSEMVESEENEKLKIEKVKRISREKASTNTPMQVTSVLRAPMPGRVLSVQVKKGDRVSGGQVAVILEAMKMENEIQIENEGIVTQLFVEENALPVKQGNKVAIKYYATVEKIVEKTPSAIIKLQKNYIWAAEHVRNYLKGKKPQVWVLRVYQLKEPYMAEPTPGAIKYANLKEEVSLEAIEPVLNDSKFKMIINNIQ